MSLSKNKHFHYGGHEKEKKTIKPYIAFLQVMSQSPVGPQLHPQRNSQRVSAATLIHLERIFITLSPSSPLLLFQK